MTLGLSGCLLLAIKNIIAVILSARVKESKTKAKVDLELKYTLTIVAVEAMNNIMQLRLTDVR